MSDAEHWIRVLQLQPHPEGGWFREEYRAPEKIPQDALPKRFGGERSFSTAIYFLLQANEVSHLHRIQQDEVWHFYDGAGLTVHVIDAAGNYSTIKLGRDIERGESLIGVVEAGSLFGASVHGAGDFSLVGCTVAPGFDFDDFELPPRAELLGAYPQHRAVIEILTRG